MRQHLRILDFALETLWRGRGKTLAVLVVYTLLVALVASLLLYVGALRREARLLLAAAPELVVQRLRAGRHEPIPVARAEEIRAIRGVTGVRPRVWGYTWDPPSGATFTLWGADSVPGEALELEAGELPGAGGCMVGGGVAEARFLWVGDRLPLRGADGTLFAPRVMGIFRASSALLTHDLVVLPTAELRRLFDLDETLATDLAVAVHQPREVDTVAAKIRQIWPDVRVLTREQSLATYDAIFDWRGGLWATLLLGAAGAFAILVWDKGTGLSAEETHTLGVLKAVGWTSGEVLELRFWEGTIVSAIAVASGLLLAEIHLLAFDGALFRPLLVGWSVLFPPLEITPGVDAYTLLLCLLLAVVPYVVASLVPAWRAAITDPDSILRS